MYAVRNIRLCTKDCLCLYVCPTGATDTETGQIDASKCLDGCRACVDACSSHAISLVPEVYPPQQDKTDTVKKALLVLSESKTQQEAIATEVARSSNDAAERQLAKMLSMSNRIMAEDLLREAGYMLPQSENVQRLLATILNESSMDPDMPQAVVKKLLSLLKEDKQPASAFKKI